jgi:hypothetical protein
MVGGDDFVQRLVEVRQKIAHVDKEWKVSGAPLVVKDRSEQQQDGNDKIEDREDANTPAREESGEKSAVGARVVEYAGNQKTGEYEEEIDTHPAAKPQSVIQT